jgi:hypothetical protein
VLSLADSKAESSSFQHVFGNCWILDQCSPYMWWKSNFEKANQRHYHFEWRIPCTWRGLKIKLWCYVSFSFETFHVLETGWFCLRVSKR